MHFELSFMMEILPTLLQALGTTLLATLLAAPLALGAGLLWAFLRLTQTGGLKKAAQVLVEFLRSTPLLIQLYFLFYVFPDFGINLSPLVTGVLGLGLYYSAYLAEVYRAGIENVSGSQWEAARALNLSRAQIWLRVILPQAIPPMLPAIGNYLVAMFKETPLLSAITVVELMQTAKIIGSETFRYLEPMTWVGILFLGLSLVSVFLLKKVEQRLKI